MTSTRRGCSTNEGAEVSDKTSAVFGTWLRWLEIVVAFCLVAGTKREDMRLTELPSFETHVQVRDGDGWRTVHAQRLEWVPGEALVHFSTRWG